MINKAVDLIYLAKQNGIDILLVEEKLQVRIPKNKEVDKNLLNELKENKDLLTEFLRENKRSNNIHNKIEKADKSTIQRIPLSFSQERLWFVDRLEGTLQYHINLLLRLKGNLNKEALENSLNTIVNRHEVLRTVFIEDEGEPSQVIMDADKWKITETDGTVFKVDKEGLQKCIQGIINVPFDLSKDHTLRANLIEISEKEFILAVTIHHIAADGWSISIIVKEFIELYDSYVEGRNSNLDPLQIQYSDYSIWQRNYLEGNLLENKLDYWKKKLTDVSPLHLPTDFTRPKDQSIRGGIAGFNLEPDVCSKLKSITQQNECTLFMTFLAAFKVLLYRYSGQSDICVGTTVANRTQKEVENLTGFFVNMLGLRSEVNGNESFIDLLKQVKRTTLNAYEHQDVPFEKVVDAVVKERDMSRSPLFQVLFAFQNTPEAEVLKMRDVEIYRESSVQSTSKFELTFSISETQNGINGSVEYRSDLYERETISRMISHFKNLLKSISDSPEESLDSLSMMDKAEEEQILTEFNGTYTDYPKDKSIIELFEQQVLYTPENVALVFEDQVLTYYELNKRSNRFAHFLRSKGLKNGTLVPLCIDRSADLLIAILGVLKAGCAYVPIDPKYPEDRIIFMLKESESSILISSHNSIKKLPEQNELTVIDFENDLNEINEQPDSDLNIDRKPEDIAYVIYTSGSTGQPKGAMVTHRNVVSLVKNVDYVSFNEKDVLISTGSPSFDATTFEYWGMLLNGGQLVMCSEDVLLDNVLLKEEIRKRKVTKMWFTSSWLNEIVENDITVFEGLKTILAGGEKLSEFHIDKIRKTYPEIEIVNGYGPTENTTFSLTYNIKDTNAADLIPIGKPLNNRTAYILNDKFQLLPVGVPGEIFLGGDGVSKGYLKRNELTAERFIADSFSIKMNGSKLYKTGDIGCWLPDGNIKYLGRIDNQVKIRGYRIEPGEIENVLNECELVKQSVVQVKETTEGNKILTAYIVPEGEFDKKEIVSFLKRKLPEYMIPSLWVEMSNLTLTKNGKVDYNALPDPDASELLKNEYESPRNELEWGMAKNWQKLLGVKKVGINDNFFELGGHSLLALRVFGYIEKLTGKKLPISTLFNFPTIKELAGILKEEGWTPKWKSLVAVRPGGSRLPFFCIPAAAGTALQFKDLLKYIPQEQPFYVLESIGNDGSEPPHTDLREMAAFYIKEIQSLQPEGPYFLGGRCFGGSVAFEMAQQLTAAGHKIALLIVFDTWPPFLMPLPVYIPPKRDAKHFVVRSFHHLKTGELFRVVKKYIAKEYAKVRFKVLSKIRYIVNDPKKRLFRELWVLHTTTYVKYIANKYPGKISMIEAEDLSMEHKDVWNYLADGGLESYLIPGSTHFTIMNEPYIKLLSDKLNYFLDKAHSEIENESVVNVSESSVKDLAEEVNA
jgi:amino acid adenylation domain-containing protein